MSSVEPDSKDCFDIILTDFQLHVQKVRNPNSLGRQMYIKNKFIGSSPEEIQELSKDI